MSATDLVADLHIHTTTSDGELTLPKVPAAARAAGVEAVAITDHDRLHSDLDAPITERDGVALIRGIELRVETDDQRLDLLGYGVCPTPELRDEIDRVQRDRIERGRRLVRGVETELGVDLDIEIEPGIGRPHVARAIADSDADYGYDEAFEELIGNGKPLHVARNVPTFERGAALLAEACGVVALAHPLRYDDPGAALARAVESDAVGGVERYYDYGGEVDTAPVERAIERDGLVPTGGSDAHDDVLGRAGLDREEYRRFRACLDRSGSGKRSEREDRPEIED